MLDVFDHRRRIRPSRTHNHIKPAGLITKPVPGEVLRRQFDKPRLLPAVHRSNRPAMRRGAARFDLHEHHRATIAGHYVNFSTSCPISPGNNCVPAPL